VLATAPGFSLLSPWLTVHVRKYPVMKTISKEQWQKIQALARKTRDSADAHNKPSTHLAGLYARSHVAAAQLGYGGTEDDWRRLCRTIMG
jgi:hypothetical protein